jgi:hypothetical protein
MLWTALVAGCGLLGRTAYYGLVLAAAKDAVAGNRLRPEIASEALLRNAAELPLGTLAQSSRRTARSPSCTRCR